MGSTEARLGEHELVEGVAVADGHEGQASRYDLQ